MFYLCLYVCACSCVRWLSTSLVSLQAVKPAYMHTYMQTYICAYMHACILAQLQACRRPRRQTERCAVSTYRQTDIRHKQSRCPLHATVLDVLCLLMWRLLAWHTALADCRPGPPESWKKTAQSPQNIGFRVWYKYVLNVSSTLSTAWNLNFDQARVNLRCYSLSPKP